MALAEQLQAAAEEGRLKRQKQDEDDAKMVIAMHKIECVCSISISFSLSLSISLCKNLDYGRADLAEQYRLESPGKFRCVVLLSNSNLCAAERLERRQAREQQQH